MGGTGVPGIHEIQSDHSRPFLQINKDPRKLKIEKRVLHVSAPDLNGCSNIDIEGLNNAHLSIASKKMAQLNPLSKLWIWIKEKICGKTFIVLQIENKTTIHLKISDLTNKIGISKQELLEAESKGNVDEVIQLALEAKTYGVPYSTILECKNRGILEELPRFKALSDFLHLPIFEFIEARKRGEFEDFVKQACEVENRCLETFKKLDKIYEEFNGELVTKNADEKIDQEMKPEDLETIKQVIRSGFKILAKHPMGTKDIEQVIPITENHRILVQSSRDSFKITGLFGKLLGFGGAGVAVHTINLMEGTWNRGDEVVLKIPLMTDKDSVQIIQEASLLKKIHGDKPVLGIQKPLRVVRNVFNGLAKHCHFGFLYQFDLFTLLLNPNKRRKFSQEDKISMAYQLIHGVVHLHSLKITNGDIKSANIFCDINQDDEIGPRLFLSDFGGGIDHSEDTVPLQLWTSTECRLYQDDVASEKAYRANDYELYRTIEEKADIFATCSVICSIFTSENPYKNSPGSRKCTIKEGLQQQLIDNGLSEETVTLLLQGLEIDYEKRPSAATIMSAVQKDLARIAPERSAILLGLSKPLPA